MRNTLQQAIASYDDPAQGPEDWSTYLTAPPASERPDEEEDKEAGEKPAAAAAAAAKDAGAAADVAMEAKAE